MLLLLRYASELAGMLLRVSHVRSLTQAGLGTLLPLTLPLARLLHEARVGRVALARELLLLA